MNRCPSTEQLWQLLAEQLPEAERDRIVSHVEDCAVCQKTLVVLSIPPTVEVRWIEGEVCRRSQHVPRSAFLRRLKQASPETPAGRGAENEDDRTLLLAEVAPLALPENWPQVPGYQVWGVLGCGGMSIVYLAWQTGLKRFVALKMLPGEQANAERLARFRGEAAAIARLQHANIVRVYEVGEVRGHPYFSLEFVEGGSLAQKLAGAPLPPRQAAELAEKLARAMHFAHQHGIVHRDLKPSNILLAYEGDAVAGEAGLCEPKITDFGLAKQLDSDDERTQTGIIMGTASYMAPEQAAGRVKELGPLSDLYALGAVLYEMLTGQPPFRGVAMLDTLDQVRSLEPVWPRRLQSKVPRDLETICLKCLQKEPARRYASAEALADDLRRFLDGRPIRARHVGAVERLRRWGRRNPVVAGLLTSVLLLLAGGVVALTISNERLTQEKNQKDEALQQAEAQRQEAEKRRRIAEMNFQRARVLLHNAPLKHQIDWLQDKGPNEAEVAAQQRALALYKGLLTEPGPDPGDRLLTAEVHRELADIYLFIGRKAEAIQEYEKAIVLLRQLVDEFPEEAGFRDSLAYCFRQTGWMKFHERAPPEEGEDAFQQAISLYEGLRQEFRDMPWYRLQLAICWGHLGELRRACQGQFAQGEDALRRALVLRQQLFDEFPARSEQRGPLAKTHNDLAWLLAIRPDRQPHHAAEALEHAQKAVDLEPGYHDWWHTLGVAHYRMGDWKKALECIEKSRDLEHKQGSPGSFDRFFEAMACWHLGDRDKARRYYDEGVQWMEKHSPEHADLRRFRSEAAELLQIQEKQTHPKDPTDTKKRK
jgi:tetratricopeptide (TPR) repeat protein